MPDGLREYVYISRRKLEALGHTLAEPSLRRIRELNVTLGPVGAGFGFADAAAPTKHQVMVEIEKAIRGSKTVKDPDAALLSPGDWVGSQGCRIAYGNPTDVWDGGAAVFAGRFGKTDLVLCGSAEHLLDRSPPTGAVTMAMSAPDQIGVLLSKAAGIKNRSGAGGDEQVLPQYAFFNLFAELTRFSPAQPAAFLARGSLRYTSGPRGGRSRGGSRPARRSTWRSPREPGCLPEQHAGKLDDALPTRTSVPVLT